MSKNEGVRARYEKQIADQDLLLKDEETRIEFCQAEIQNSEEVISAVRKERHRLLVEFGQELKREFRERVIGMTVQEANTLDETLSVYTVLEGNTPKVYMPDATTGTTCLLVETTDGRIVKAHAFGARCSNLK